MIQIDVQMPSNCYDCWIRKNLDCRIANDNGWLNNKRADDCPLKAQEPVEPKKVNRYIDFDGEGKPFIPETYDCGSCGKELPWKAKYCPECGRAVKAEWATYNEPLYITIDMPTTDESSRKEK